MERYELPDRDNRTIRFTGRMIGQADTREGEAERWTSVSVYRTEGGNYIVHVIGHSTVDGERNRYTCHTADGPDGAVESLHQVDSDGVRYITKVARRAAEEAATVDHEFALAFSIEDVA